MQVRVHGITRCGWCLFALLVTLPNQIILKDVTAIRTKYCQVVPNSIVLACAEFSLKPIVVGNMNWIFPRIWEIAVQAKGKSIQWECSKKVHERTKITGWHPSYCLSKFRMKQEAKAPNEFWGRTNIKRVPGTGSLGCWTAWPLEWDCAGPQSLWSLGWRFSQEFTNTLRSQSAEDWRVGKRYWPWGDEVLDGNNPILQRLRTVMWHRSPRGLSGRPWRPEQHCRQRHWAWKDFIRT